MPFLNTMESQQIVAFLFSGLYYITEYKSGIFFPPRSFNPMDHHYVSAPPRSDWINYIKNYTFEIYNGIECKPIVLESVVETLETIEGLIIPVMRLANGHLPAIYEQIPPSQIMRKSRSMEYFQQLAKESEDTCIVLVAQPSPLAPI